MHWERIDYKPEWFCLQCGARYEVGSNPPTVAGGERNNPGAQL